MPRCYKTSYSDIGLNVSFRRSIIKRALRELAIAATDSSDYEILFSKFSAMEAVTSRLLDSSLGLAPVTPRPRHNVFLGAEILEYECWMDESLVNDREVEDQVYLRGWGSRSA
ncbi:hypothetical protein TWF730_008767 [Orbilia blumenaviensis]|uniref:Uncharacterized protein n=1 Tax=Orbilia blumenaviensis TaxID=1796055 RepID=A0AAV9V412_9PEZI